ncbi:unnamed protein product [Arctogadus glacialis]
MSRRRLELRGRRRPLLSEAPPYDPSSRAAGRLASDPRNGYSSDPQHPPEDRPSTHRRTGSGHSLSR